MWPLPATGIDRALSALLPQTTRYWSVVDGSVAIPDGGVRIIWGYGRAFPSTNVVANFNGVAETTQLPPSATMSVSFTAASDQTDIYFTCR